MTVCVARPIVRVHPFGSRANANPDDKYLLTHHLA